jgi:hypothetical protein
MFLQVYHHAGVVILMWMIVATNSTCAGGILTLFNSFIHSLMYSYYTAAAMGFNSSLKSTLTLAQIIQFVVGIACTLRCHFIGGCSTPAQGLTIAIIQLYVVGLIYLFYDFFVRSYGKKTK